MSESKWLPYECGAMSGLKRGDYVFLLRDRKVSISEAQKMIHGDKWIRIDVPDAPESDGPIVTALKKLRDQPGLTGPFTNGFNSGIEAAINIVQEFEK